VSVPVAAAPRRHFLIFSPHSSVWVHAFPEALMAETLLRAGHQVTMVGCRGAMARQCTTFGANGFTGPIDPATRNAICGACTRQQALLSSEMGLQRVYIEDLLTAEDRSAIAALDAQPVERLVDLERDGIPVGRLATYETVLAAKKRNFLFTDAEAESYRGYLQGALMAMTAVGRLLEHDRPYAVVTYNSLYAVNRCISLLAQSRGIRTISLHAGTNLSNRLESLMIVEGNNFDHMRHLKTLWPRYESLPLSPAVARRVTDHLLEVIRGDSVFAYSAPVTATSNVRERFGVKAHQRVLLATTSSHDERFAAETIGAVAPMPAALFAEQVEWIKHLFSLVAARDDLFLVVRVHPREFPNKREGQLSEHARQLQKEFAEAPRNVAINWPSDQISMYDLACETDVVLNGWSSAGKEMAMLGIPVVGYSAELLGYPASLNAIGETAHAYEAAIEQALATGWSFERIRMTYRWLALEHVHSAVNIGDGFSARRQKGRSGRVLNGISRRLWGPDFAERRDLRRRPHRLAQADVAVQAFMEPAKSVADVVSPDAVSTELETASLTHELGRIAEALHLERRRGTPLAQAILGFLERAKA
jgi:hypothetical protein